MSIPKHRLTLILLLAYTLLTRLPYLLHQTIPFTFDHGRDSIAILHMIKTFSPKFIGPWTSIPGLFFGPGWYYLLTPAFLISNGHPVAPVFILVLLLLLTIYLAYKHFGPIPAIIISSAPAWITISQSAWNPFPMPLITLIILIIFKQTTNKNLAPQLAFLLGFITALSFHFSSAYAVSYLLSLPLIFLITSRFRQLNRRSFLYLLLGFILPWIPQLLFEVRHQFIQTQGIIAYFKNPLQEVVSHPPLYIIQDILNQLRLAITPEIRPFSQINRPIQIIAIIIILYSLINSIRRKNLPPHLIESLILIIIPTLILLITHYNFWYAYAMLSITVIIFSHCLKLLPKFIQYPYLALILLTPTFHLIHFYTNDIQNFHQSRQFLPPKLEAIRQIRSLSQGQPFASYHYVPDIYDYSYQYLYLWQAFNGQPLPTEFTYQPGKITYIPEKPDLLNKLPSPPSTPQHIFFIVEKPEYPSFLENWWHHQHYTQITRTIKISPEITLYQATP